MQKMGELPFSRWGNVFKLVNKNKISANQKKRVYINKTV